MQKRLKCLLLTLVSAISQFASGQDHEQSVFAMEGIALRRPVNVPAPVLKLLREDESVTACRQDQTDSTIIPSYWFVGSKVSLSTSVGTDLVVVPRNISGAEKRVNACLLGAHTMPFWIFRKFDNQYRLVFSGSAQVLRLLDTSTNGLRDVETSISSTVGNTISHFRFDGHDYILADRKTTPP